MVTQDDSEFVARARQGDRPAFGELVRRHQDGVFRFIYRMVGSRDEAMDLTQDSFMKAFQALPDWRPEAQFRTWLFRIARNASLDVLRRRGLVEFVTIDDESTLPGGDPTPEERLGSAQRIRLLEESLRQLPVDHREVLLLREIEDLSYGEIAAALGIAEGTVKSRIARARVALIAAWQRRTGEHPNE